MTILTHTLGFPRVGLRRELKKAQESYWAGNTTREALLAVGRELRARHWEQQKQAGIDLLPVGDFAWYDHVLTTSLLLGNVPARHQNNDGSVDIDTLFRIGRGRAPTGEPAAAAEMTKWFNTNYHYIVPEFSKGQQFRLTWTQLLEEVDEALALGHKIKPVLLGPVTYLWLGKVKGEPFDRLTLLKDILPVYQHVLAELAKRGIEWVQIDEPALVLELPQAWLDAFKPAYDALAGQVKLLLTTYFEGVTPNLDTIIALPVQGLHVDLIHGKDDVAELHQRLPVDWLLSAGLINGRNVWRADLTEKYAQINAIVGKRALWVASSCSLLHSPIDLSVETRLDTEVKSWFAFALQKCGELALLRDALNSGETAALEEWSAPIQARRHSRRVHNAAVEKRLAAITAQDSQRENPYEVRAEAQRARFKLRLADDDYRFVSANHGDSRSASGLQKGQPRREPLPHRHRRTYQTGYHRAGAFRAGCAGTRRSRAKRHGGILRRASGRLRLYPEWLGAKLWLPLCETAGSDWRYQPSGTDYRGVGEICPVADRQAGKRDVDRPGDYSLLVIPPRRRDPRNDCETDCAGAA